MDTVYRVCLIRDEKPYTVTETLRTDEANSFFISYRGLFYKFDTTVLFQQSFEKTLVFTAIWINPYSD